MQTNIAEKADAIMSPMIADKMIVPARLPTYGSMIVKGAAPKIENHITYLRP